MYCRLREMVDTETLRTIPVLQEDTISAVISPLPMENRFHPLSTVDGQSDTRRIAQTYPPLVQPPPLPTTLGHSPVARFRTVLRQVGDHTDRSEMAVI